MLRPTLVVMLLMAAMPAEARFGKASGGRSSGSRGSSSSSSYSPSGGSSFSAGRYAYGGPRRYAGFGYGYGYSFFYRPYTAPVMLAPVGYPAYEPETAAIRATFGFEGQGHATGATLGLFGQFEGEYWGVSLAAADIIAKADDGSGGVDHIGDFAAHLTFAPLSGRYGRLRLEGGADVFIAPSAVLVGPTVGLSGVVWFGCPVGLDASINVTPWPFTQVDAKLGLAFGYESWGFRVGWRVQHLDDRGLVDGISHTDTFNGPYLGVSYVL